MAVSAMDTVPFLPLKICTMLRKQTLPHLLFIGFIILFAACDKDETNVGEMLVGTWQLKTVMIDGNPVDITGRQDMIQFQNNSIYQACNTTETSKIRGGWSYIDDMLNISTDLPAAYYILEINSVTLSLERFDFKSDGSLQSTVLNYEKVSDSLFPN